MKRLFRGNSVWWKRTTRAGFAFFLAKGLLWLLAPLVLYFFS
jgi:hypothetical protein